MCEQHPGLRVDLPVQLGLLKVKVLSERCANFVQTQSQQDTKEYLNQRGT